MSEDYTTRHISVLEGLEAVRKRPGMYIGSTDERGLMHCLWEIIDNSVDEALAGYGQLIEVVLHPDHSFEVRDRGRGIPVDNNHRTGLSGVELVFTRLHAGGKFGSGSYVASGGLHGVGASVVNALSSKLLVQVYRDGRAYRMEFTHGRASELMVMGASPDLTSGTLVRFWPDRQIFGDADCQLDALLARARQTAFLAPGLEICIEDRRSAEVQNYNFVFAGGIAAFAEYLAPADPVTGVWRISGSENFMETVPVLNQKGSLESREVERRCEVDVALLWSNDFDTRLKSFVNVIATPKGGTHQAGFEAGLVKFFRQEVERQARQLKVGSARLEKEDVLAGLTAILTVRLAEPQFEGQTKEVLGTAPVKGIVSRVLLAGLAERFSRSSKADKLRSRELLDKLVSEMKARISARALRETQRRKSALENSALPTKLVDCRSGDVGRSELFIVEGDSALGTARKARNSEYQALLPIRGKILNVQKAGVAEVLSNAECAAIIQVLGAGSGSNFDLSQARYGKIIIMSDADVDGAHIRTLLLTLFFRYMRPLVASGRVFAAVPPLHRVLVHNPGSKPNETVYTYSETQLAELLSSLQKAGKKHQDPIQRYKGLGEMDADQLADTTMDRAKRLLLRVNLVDAHRASNTFNLLMGSEVAPRRRFIAESSEQISPGEIDA